MKTNDVSKVSKKYRKQIVDIYNKNHVSTFTDIDKHNKGIIKAMAEFAIFYKDLNNEKIQNKECQT